jgi:dienelactone hydrolase
MTAPPFLPSSPYTRRAFLHSLALGGASTVAFGAAGLAKLPTVDEEIRRAAKAAALRLVFKGGTPGEFAAWRQEFSAALRQRVGSHHPPEHWSAQMLSRVELRDHLREEWLLAASGMASLPLYILKPAGTRTAARLPVVVALHGHGEFAHDAVAGIDDTPERVQDIQHYNYDFGRQIAREGYLVVAPCMTPFGRRRGESYRKGTTDPCAVAFVRLMLLGQTLMGANLRDVSWAVSYAQSRADARQDRVGCVGLSYGGRMTMLASALDERIAVAVVSGALNVMQERVEGRYSCGAQVIPGLLEIGDTPEIGSLIAPRPCIWEVGSKDSLVKPGWADAAKVRLRRAYAAAGNPAALQFHHFEGGHRWDGVTALPLLAKVLQS